MSRVQYVLLVILFGFVFYSNTEAQDDVLPQLPGRIAYIGADLNVYTLNLQNNRTIPLTDDGNARRVYQWPTWSTDGRLAYFLTALDQEGFSTDVFISRDGETPGASVYSSDTEFFTYAYWSPENCSNDENCRNLAVLFSSVTDPLFAVKLIHDGSKPIPETLTGQGAPFYYSWSPDGKQMLWQRNNQRMDIYDVASGSLVSSLPQTPGSFQAPGWSPVDNRWLFGSLAEDRQSTDLIILANDDSSVLAPNLTGPIAFSWSPDGNFVAYIDAQGPLVIVDSRSGEAVSRSSVNGILAFFWSPDSKRVAYVTLAVPPGSFNADLQDLTPKTAAFVQDATGIAWSILDLDTGTMRRYGSFLPTREMVYLLSFFDQFAQSHRIWSPDSRYLMYSEVTADNRQIINVLDTTQADTIPLSITEGRIGIWSFN